MIGRIQGLLLERRAPELLIDVQGVGYEVQVPMSTVYQLPALGQTVTLFTHFSVREDAQQLFGFASQRERELFRLLIRVNGVGPKLALGILSSMDVDGFVRCVRDADSATLVRIPGVGKKTAERLLVEVRDRLKAWQVAAGVDTDVMPELPAAGDSLAEAESALVSLGYKPQEAARAIAAVQGEGSQDSAELIRRALQNMVRKN